ncbi:MAG: MFS transporter [Candidatus Omnitrophica bacterium]|nr:MFS transporter [Candidatus Omnitrophota bacterium]MCM8825202.1 MFS transporter [Candidatus Omnitrophota bacterium]
MENWKKHLYIIWLAETISMIGFHFCLPFLPYYVQELGPADLKQAALWTGLLQTVGPLMLVISSPFWGVLSDRFGRKIMVERAMFSGFVVLVLMSFVRTVQQLLILRILQGFFTGTFTAAIVLAASQIPKEKSGYGLGLMQTSIFIAATIGPFLGGVLSDIWGYRNTFYFSGILVGIAGCLVMFFVQEPEKNNHQQEEEQHQTDGSKNNLLFLLVVLFLFQCASTFISPVLALFVKKISPEARKIATIAGSILAASGIASVFGAVFAGNLASKKDHRALLSIMLPIAGVITILSFLARTAGQLMFLRILAGLSAGGIIPTINTHINLETKRSHLGRNFGVAGGISSLGAGVGPMIGGAIASIYSLETSFVFSGILIILTGALCPVLLEKTELVRKEKLPEISEL